MKKIKILITSTSGFARKEGISTVIIDYFSRFNLGQFEPHIVIAGEFDKRLIEELRAAGIRTKYLHSRKKELIPYIRDLFRLLKYEKYDAIYVNGSSAIMSIELFVAKICGCKARIVHSHNTTCDHRIADMMLRPVFYKLYTDAFACGHEAGKWLFGKRDFTIIRNGRDISKYRFDEVKRIKVRQQMKISDDCLLVGHVGNFNNQKNHQFVLNVFKELLKIKENAKLYLMGAGEMLDEIKHLAVELEIADKIIFTGSIDNVGEMLQAMDVMLLPSLHEGLPLVVVEWQIAALPSIISDCITSECKYSDLVHHMSLDKPYQEWAKKIIHLSAFDRKGNADRLVELTRKNGYDINENVLKLQKIFINAVCY